jgi:hypothetical protein
MCGISVVTLHTREVAGSSPAVLMKVPANLTPLCLCDRGGTGLRSRKGSARPPHRSQRALLAHWAPPLGFGVKTRFRVGMLDAGWR